MAHEMRVCIVSASLLLIAGPAAAADQFLHIEGLSPPVTTGHAGWVQLINVQEGLTGIPAVTGGGSAVGTPKFQDIVVTKSIDALSPQLRKYLTSGKHVARVQIDFVKGGVGSQAYFTIELKEVAFTSIAALATANEPTETVGLTFSEIKWRYFPQNANGTLGTPVEASWNLKLNQP